MASEIVKERMLRWLKETIGEHWGNDNNLEMLQKMFLTDLNGCSIPQEYLDDVLQDIMDKFYFFFAAIRNEVDNHIEIYISPSYEDSTTAIMILDDRVLYKKDFKAWDFWFKSEEALVDKMYSIYLMLLSKIEKCNQ